MEADLRMRKNESLLPDQNRAGANNPDAWLAEEALDLDRLVEEKRRREAEILALEKRIREIARTNRSSVCY